MTCLATSTAIKEFPSCRGSKKPLGRPRSASSEQALKPWIAAGISERTYHRRKAELAAAHLQSSAHVAAWKALTSFERLDLISAARNVARAAVRRRPFGEEIEIAIRKRAH